MRFEFKNLTYNFYIKKESNIKVQKSTKSSLISHPFMAAYLEILRIILNYFVLF